MKRFLALLLLGLACAARGEEWINGRGASGGLVAGSSVLSGGAASSVVVTDSAGKITTDTDFTFDGTTTTVTALDIGGLGGGFNTGSMGLGGGYYLRKGAAQGVQFDLNFFMGTGFNISMGAGSEVSLDDGVIGTPAIGFQSEPALGFYRPSEGNLAFVDDGAAILNLNSSGITSSVAAWTYGVDTAVTLSGGVNGLNFDSNTLSIDATGNFVGFGTAAPTAAADVLGNLRITGFEVDTSSSITVPDNGGGGAATYTLTPTRKYVLITCSDANGCDITMGESGMVDGTDGVRIYNIGTNVCNFADTSGVSELAGAFAMGFADTLRLSYAVDRWIEDGRSNN